MMNTLFILIKRNIRLFFRDKGMFFTSLVTPAILLILYATFLSNVYRESYVTGETPLPADVVDGLVSGQLVSSLLAVCCVTIAFCSNFLMVQDRANGCAKDLLASPVKAHSLALSYYIASFFSTLLMSFAAAGLGLCYMAVAGWYLTAADVFFTLLDVLLLVLFGTALSSLINFFLSSQGQIAAVGTIVSAGYGFICGAYMPIYSFSSVLQKIVAFLPGTYGTSLFRNHLMQGAIEELANRGMGAETTELLRDITDCNLYFFGERVEVWVMYLVLALTTLLLLGAYILLQYLRQRRTRR